MIYQLFKVFKEFNRLSLKLNILNPKKSISFKDVLDLKEIARKVDIQYIYHFEIPINPNFDNIDVKREDIFGSIDSYSYFIEISKEFFED